MERKNLIVSYPAFSSWFSSDGLGCFRGSTGCQERDAILFKHAPLPSLFFSSFHYLFGYVHSYITLDEAYMFLNESVQGDLYPNEL